MKRTSLCIAALFAAFALSSATGISWGTFEKTERPFTINGAESVN